MKSGFLLLTCICLVMGIGIVTAGSSLNLTGKWKEETFNGFSYSGEIINTTSESDYWILTQHDNLVSGSNYFYDGEKIVEEPVAGIISPDEKTVNIVDVSGGTYLVYITDVDTLTVYYLNTGDKKEESNYALAFSEVLKRME